jgi:RecA-family ATPase
VPHDSPNSQTAEYPLLRLTSWADAFNRPPVDAVVDGLLIPGRWTALVAPAKAGKSTLALHIAHCLARGLEPFTGATQVPVPVLYVDGEMGELDVVERLRALDQTPADLELLHYSDLPPKGDTMPGGLALTSAAQHLGAVVVILDGLNAFISGAEKDDVPWRALYEHTIAPLKRAGCAVLSSDNTGKDPTLSARGSSVKLDKADAIMEVKRTEAGVKVSTTHQRSAAFHRDFMLAMSGLDGVEPISYCHCVSSWPTGTQAAVTVLDDLGLPENDGLIWPHFGGVAPV